MINKSSLLKILKGAILVSGAIARTAIGIGATALVFLALKKKSKKWLNIKTGAGGGSWTHTVLPPPDFESENYLKSYSL